jgi:uncharacterized protein (TIGR03086 family)
MDEATAFRRASDGYLRRAERIGSDQWPAATPCTQWDVRALVNHVTGEYLWLPELMAGKTVAEVGSRFDGDVLGDDPLGVLTDSFESAQAAANSPDALTGTVHLSFGDVKGAEYLEQMAIDSVLHAWDLARAIGADEALDPELVDFAYAFLQRHAEEWRSGGALGPAKEPVDDSAQARMLALSGR